MKEEIQTNIDLNTSCLLESQKKVGVYCILNTYNQKFYIGSVIKTKSKSNKQSFRARWQKHMGDLIKNQHCNTHLQGAFSSLGREYFKFIILEIIDNENSDYILQREQWWIDNSNCLNPNIGYNKYPKAICINEDYQVSKETRKKLRNSLKGKPRPMWMKLKYGKPIIQYSLNMEYINEYYSMTEAERQTGIHRTGIKECVNFRYKHAGGFIWRYKNLNN